MIDRLREHEVEVERLELSGAVSSVGVLGQAIADACLLPAQVRENPEASIEGVALLTAQAAGAAPPRLSIRGGAAFEPTRDLSTEREAFA